MNGLLKGMGLADASPVLVLATLHEKL